MKSRKQRSRRPNFKTSQSAGRGSRFFSSRYLIIASLFAVLVATGVLATRLRVETKNRKKELAAAKEPVKSYSELELALDSGEKQRLIGVMDQLKIEPGEEFAVQLEKIKNRLKVSEELQAINGDPEARQLGLLSGLDALTLWHTLNVIYQVDDPLMQDKLQELAGEHVQDADKKVAARANYVLALVEIHQFILNKDPQKFQQGLVHYTATLDNVDENLVEAIRISNLASLLAKTGHDEEVKQMWGAFYRRFDGAQNEAIQALALKAYDQYVFCGSPVSLSMGKIINGDSNAVAGLQQQIDALVSSNDLSDSGFDMLLAMLEVLVQNGNITEVQEIGNSLLTRLPAISGKAVQQDVEKKIKATLNRANLMGQVVRFNGLAVGEGRTFDSSILDGSMVVAVFWSPKNKLSMERLSNVHKMVSLFDDGRLNLVAIFNPPQEVPTTKNLGEEQESVAQLKPDYLEFMTSLPNCRFLKVKSEDLEMQEFLKRLGPPFLPYILMVDSDHRIIALNPNPDYLVQTLGNQEGE